MKPTTPLKPMRHLAVSLRYGRLDVDETTDPVRPIRFVAKALGLAENTCRTMVKDHIRLLQETPDLADWLTPREVVQEEK